MPRTIIPNVPVRDVEKTRAFSTENAQDHGSMYARSFQDLDGHHREVFHMDEAALEEMTRSGQ